MRTEEEKRLRRLLAYQHTHRDIDGCAYMYFDDGEMSCVVCRADFLRDTVEQLEQAIIKYNVKVIHESCIRAT